MNKQQVVNATMHYMISTIKENDLTKNGPEILLNLSDRAIRVSYDAFKAVGQGAMYLLVIQDCIEELRQQK